MYVGKNKMYARVCGTAQIRSFVCAPSCTSTERYAASQFVFDCRSGSCVNCLRHSNLKRRRSQLFIVLLQCLEAPQITQR
jgi:hypothetical protein